MIWSLLADVLVVIHFAFTAFVIFGGPHFDTIYATCRDQVYSRRVKTHGANAFEAPIKPAPPRL